MAKDAQEEHTSIVFATQAPPDSDGAAIAPAIIKSYQTRLRLPNERIVEPQITAIYRCLARTPEIGQSACDEC